MSASRRVLTGLVVLLLAAGCGSRRETVVTGNLALASGAEGDVRRARVELRRTRDITEPPDYAVRADSGAWFYRAGFALAGVKSDSYYVLAWQDNDADETLGDGDLVGVNQGEYGRHALGASLWVGDGETTRVWEIVLDRLTQVIVRVEAERYDSGRATRFGYRFNRDVELSMLEVSFPGLDTLPDPDAVGPKPADSACVSEGWRNGGAPMPTGWHGLVFRGTAKQRPFVTGVAVFVR